MSHHVSEKSPDLPTSLALGDILDSTVVGTCAVLDREESDCHAWTTEVE